jgi:pimeloyl-ACP methyl ester carboxylesterase
MYPGRWQSLPEFQAHDWMRHTGEKTVAEVARSMCYSCSIHDGDVLVGTSLGGMVACEITKIREIPMLFLVASAVTKEEVSSLLAALKPLIRITPIEAIQFSAGSIPLERSEMFLGVEASFIRSMCAAVFEWEGLGVTRTRVFRIHGKHDHVIPAPKNVDLLLDGGHLLTMTQADECAEFIRSNLQSGADWRQPSNADSNPRPKPAASSRSL